MKHIKRLLPFLVLVFIVSSCGDSTSNDPIEASIQLLNETDDLADASTEIKKEAIVKLAQRREQNKEVADFIEDAIREENDPSTKKNLIFRKERLRELNTNLNKRIVALEGAKINLTLQQVVEEPDSTQSNLLNKNDSLATQEIEEALVEPEDSTVAAEVAEEEPTEEVKEENTSPGEPNDEVDRAKLLNEVVPEGVIFFWTKVFGVILGFVILVLLGMHFIPKIINKIRSGGFSWPSLNLGGFGSFFSGMFSGLSGVANRRRRRILLGSLLGLLLLISLGFLGYQYGGDAMTAVSEVFTSDSDDRRVADYRDKKDLQDVTPAPYPPGYDENGNLIEVSDSTKTEELDEIEIEEEIEEGRKKGSGSGRGGGSSDKKLEEKIRKLEQKIKNLEKEERLAKRGKGESSSKKGDAKADKPSPKKASRGLAAARKGNRVNQAQTEFPKSYGIGSDKDLSAARSGSR